MTKPLPEFSVEAKVQIITSVYVVATDLADALEKAKTMSIQDFVKIIGEHNDSRFEVVGVLSKNGWDLR